MEGSITYVINCARKLPVALEIIKDYYLKYPQNIDNVEHNSTTPLIIASLLGYTTSTKETVRMLLNLGADPNITTAKGTALTYAFQFEEEEEIRSGIIKMLLKAGADPNIRDDDGWYPLAIILRFGNSKKTEKLIQLLIKYGANVNLLDAVGRNSLTFCCENPGIYTERHVEVLINAGADVNLKDDWGYAPLVLAIKKDNRKLVELLVLAGANTEIPKFQSTQSANHFVKCVGSKAMRDTYKKIFSQRVLIKLRRYSTAFRLIPGRYGEKILRYNFRLYHFDEKTIYNEIHESCPDLLDYLTIRNHEDIKKIKEYVDYL